MMDTEMTSQLVGDIGAESSNYLGRKTGPSASPSNPLLTRHIQNHISSAMGMEDTVMDRSRRSPSSDLSERELEEEQSWSGDMDIDSDDQGHGQDDEVEHDESLSMDMSE